MSEPLADIPKPWRKFRDLGAVSDCTAGHAASVGGKCLEGTHFFVSFFVRVKNEKKF